MIRAIWSSFCLVVLIGFPKLESLEQKNGYNNADFYTNGELFFVETYLKSATTIFDVGANAGEWSLALSKYCPLSTIYAFEPHPGVFKILKRNLLGLHRAECFCLGLGSEVKRVPFFVWGEVNDMEKSGLNGIYYRPILRELLNKKCKQINIQLTTLDVFCAERDIRHIDFLKIDTEGAEWDVLMGAIQLISQKAIDMVQFEYGGTYLDSKIKLKDVWLFLKKHEYDVFLIFSDGLKEISEWNDTLENYQYSNYIAILRH